MKVTIIGAGSAGLSAAIAIRRMANAEVRILERSGEHETPGLGIALLPFALNELQMMNLPGLADFKTAGVNVPRLMHVFAGEAEDSEVLSQSRGQETQYWGVKRSALLAFLREGARHAGAEIEYNSDIGPDRFEELRATSDVLVGADGAGSLVRNAYLDEFNPIGEDATSRYAWLELEGPLDRFVFGYMRVQGKGLVRITAYPHSSTEASAIITHSHELTDYFDATGMVLPDGTISDAGLAAITSTFSAGVGGKDLTGTTRWRRFRATHSRRAAFGNVALVGDAYATAHYETGWGTSAALQQARILGHILGFGASKGKPVEETLDIYARKSAEVDGGLIDTTLRVMRELDSQSLKFAEGGAARFLDLVTP